MPTSNLGCWPWVLHYVHEARAKRVLDVGPGRGKAGVLLREYCADVEQIDAIEAWAPYITQRLEAIYDAVYHGDVRDLHPDALAGYDLVLMVDVIEHLDKPDALALLERITGHVVICTPEAWFQNPEGEAIPPEKHRSLWTLEDFGDRVEAHGSLHMCPTCGQEHASVQGGLIVRLSSLSSEVPS